MLSKRSVFHPFRIVNLGMVLAKSSLITFGCSDAPSETATPEDAAENITTGEVADGTEGLIGKTVSVRSEVGEMVGEVAFLLEDNSLLGGEDVLVINASGEPIVLPEGDGTPVQVTGEVQQLVIADFETEYGLALDPSIYSDYEGRPVLIARSAALSPDPGDLTISPHLYHNKRIAVQGEIEELLSPQLFTLDEEKLFGAEDLLVFVDAINPEAQVGEEVVITGTLRPYVKAEFETEYDFDLGRAEEKVEVEYSGKPVFIADGVYPSAL